MDIIRIVVLTNDQDIIKTDIVSITMIDLIRIPEHTIEIAVEPMREQIIEIIMAERTAELMLERMIEIM